MTFEVGKTYVAAKNLKGPKLRCIVKTPKGNFVLNDLQSETDWCGILAPQEYSKFIEYVEPKSGEFWVNIYPDSFQYKTKEQADSFAREDRIAVKCVRWAEGDEE